MGMSLWIKCPVWKASLVVISVVMQSNIAVQEAFHMPALQGLDPH